MTGRLALATLVLLLFPLATDQVGATPDELPPETIELRPASVIFGEARLALLSADFVGDLNGDGAADLVFDWFPTQTRNHRLDAVAMGRANWPASAGLSQLEQLHSLGFPTIDDLRLPNTPIYAVQDLLDISGDGLDDLVIRKDEYRGGENSASEARVYFGHAGWGPIDVKSREPDLVVRQERVPRTMSEAERFLMPDTVIAGDFNGDGHRDVAVGSCGNTLDLSIGPSPLQLYFAPAGGLRRVDLSVTKPSVVIKGARSEQVGCFMAEDDAADIDGDGLTDLLLNSGATELTWKSYIALGRPTWPTEARIQDVGDIVLDHQSTEGGVTAWRVDDISGDGRKEVVASYHDDGARRRMQCVWFGGHVFAPKQDVTDCDVRVTDEFIRHIGDVTGDGLNDLLFGWPPATGRPVTEWRIVSGPIASSTDLAVGKRGTGGDYVIRLPEPPADSYTPGWLFDDVTGDGLDDLILDTFSQDSPNGLWEAGVVAIHVGPLVGETAVPIPPSATRTAEPSVTPAQPPASRTPEASTPTVPSSPTSTDEATAVPPTMAPTEGPRRAVVFLPIAYTGQPDD